MANTLRSKELGLLVVIGGPGGSGSSTISKFLAQKWYLHRLYGGEIIRKKAGTQTVENFIDEELKNSHTIDKEVDQYLLKMSYQKNILIESKVLSALLTKKFIPATLKIWLYADVDTSVRRIFKRESWDFDSSKFEEEKMALEERRSNDIARYKKIYNVDISKPETYNDIVIDSSKLDIYNTTNLIIDTIKADKTLSKRFPPDYLKY